MNEEQNFEKEHSWKTGTAWFLTLSCRAFCLSSVWVHLISALLLSWLHSAPRRLQLVFCSMAFTKLVIFGMLFCAFDLANTDSFFKSLLNCHLLVVALPGYSSNYITLFYFSLSYTSVLFFLSNCHTVYKWVYVLRCITNTIYHKFLGSGYWVCSPLYNQPLAQCLAQVSCYNKIS